MIQTTFKTAWRNLLRNKFFAGLNILGLALGLAVCVLIATWVYVQWSFNRGHANQDRLFRVLRTITIQGKTPVTTFSNSIALNSYLKTEVPEVEKATIIFQNEFAVRYADKPPINVGRVMCTDENFTQMFSFKFVSGDPATCLINKASVVLTESTAKKIFGEESPIGKVILLDNNLQAVVSGIVADPPPTSQVYFNMAVRADYTVGFYRNNANKWDNNWPNTYILLRPNADPTALQAKLYNLLEEKNKTVGTAQKLSLQTIKDQHLWNRFENGQPVGGRIEQIRNFTIIALLVLGIAAINFMNLSAARSMSRSREVGVRKSVGATESMIFRQVLIESVITAYIALPFALLIAELTMPLLQSIMPNSLRSAYAVPYTLPLFWLGAMLITGLTGLLAGLYPAVVLAQYNVVEILKGTVKSGRGALLFRKILVVFEFSVAVVFIIAMAIMYRQMEYVRTKNIGVEKDHILTMTLGQMSHDKWEAFRAELKQSPLVENAAYSQISPINVGSDTWGLEWPGKKPDERLTVYQVWGGYDLIETLGLSVIEGRSYKKDAVLDTNNFIFNEAAVKAMGLAKEPLRQQIKWGNNAPGEVIGVIKDYHLHSMKNGIEPMMIKLNAPDSVSGLVYVRMKAGVVGGVQTEDNIGKNTPLQVAIETMRTLSAKYQPYTPFEYEFLNREYNDMYFVEQAEGKLSTFFASVALFICCLGLLGLATYTAERRTKEIGVRKVLGASIQDIIILLSKDFMLLVAIAFVVGSPIAYYFVNKWLEDFKYRIEFNAGTFMFAGVCAVVIAFLSVAWQSWKAATVNPVQSIKTE